jgi:hypothetical protein
VNRRHFLASSAAASAFLAAQTAAAQSAKSRIDRNRISAISDEVSMSPEEAIAFAHHFGLHWLELRDVPALPGQGKPFFFLPDAEPRWHAKLFRDGGIRISFINTNLLDTDQPIDWAPIFAAMDDDGYAGQIDLETHYFDGTKLERSHLAMDKIVKLADANALRT